MSLILKFNECYFKRRERRHKGEGHEKTGGGWVCAAVGKEHLEPTDTGEKSKGHLLILQKECGPTNAF